jgi:hypothetical protein
MGQNGCMWWSSAKRAAKEHFSAEFLLLWNEVGCFRSPEASAMVQRTVA